MKCLIMKVIVLLIFFLFNEISFSSSIFCPKHQSISLLKFKQTLTIDSYASDYCEMYFDQKPYPKTSSWNMSIDCCSWDGVICDEITGHVIELDLGCSNLVGIIDSNSSLFQLSHLQRLNLSWNNFSHSHISPEIGRFSTLTHLDLSDSYFSGQIPSEISHLSKLQSLLLSAKFFRNDLTLTTHDFKLLLQNLTELKELDFNFVNISSTIPLNFSSHLTNLRLKGTGLYGIIPESIFHLFNLKTLDLENNDQLSGYFPNTKWNSSASLMTLDLSFVSFSNDFLPESLGHLTSLQSLELHSCNLSGPIPESLWNLTRIVTLDLRDNSLEGPIPLFSSGLQNLYVLFLSNNSLNGAIPSWIFTLPSLGLLDLSGNHFSGQLEDFKYNTIEWIILTDNQLEGPLPKSFQNLVNLDILALSSNNFSGDVDVSLFSNLKQLSSLQLSYNSISLTNVNKVKSTLPESLTNLELSACEVKEVEFLRSAKQLYSLTLSNNKIQGTVDQITFLPQLIFLDLQFNLLQGSIPDLPHYLTHLFISNNSLSGEIPTSICNLTSLKVLDLARNNLNGEIPHCLGSMSDQLEVLDMRHNSFSGNLQTTFSSGSQLKSFNLHGNKLEGKIPRSLANCKQLEVLDLGNNHLNDTFPMWLGTLPNLQVLSLRYNKLHGSIRTSRINNLFPQLRMLDLSCNAFTAELPTSFLQNLKAMRRIDQTIMAPNNEYYEDSVTVVTKGLELEVVRILSLYTTMDLSNNKFEGHIPSMMGDLIALRVLNLSHNGLQGHIPTSLGKLSVVESLDLSSNKLSGGIPKQLASLTSLAVLDLSRNHLEGCIPKGNQFDTFGNTSYEGNDGLRGFPVSGSCGSNMIPETNNATFVLDEESDSTFLSELSWKVVLMGYGFGLFIGFSISYVMLSSRKSNWLLGITEDLEYRIIMRRRKKQQGQMHYRRRRRRSNGI